MDVIRNPQRLLLVAVAATMASAQQTGSMTPAVTSPAAIAATTAAEAATTTDVPLSLWSIANGLLSSYYPSTSLDGVATLTWPDTVVIGGTTFNMQSTSIAATGLSTQQAGVSSAETSVLPKATDSPANQSPKKNFWDDKKLGIILGCVIGIVTLILLGVVFWCLKRRKDDTGSFFMRRRTPSIASTRSEIRSWLPGSRPDTYGNTTYVSAGGNNLDSWEKQPAVGSRPEMGEPRMSHHPAFAAARVNGSSRSTSEDNPFYTPAERFDVQLGHDPDLERGAYDPHPVELDDNGHARPRSSGSLHATGDRPPTPFSPMEMMGFGASKAAPSSQVERRDFGQNPAQGQQHTNPFASPEDGEEDDLVSPILPSRSPERRHSPTVHYPSWSEVSEFDFHGDGRQSVRNVSSVETDGGDGWHPVQERTQGRYELA